MKDIDRTPKKNILDLKKSSLPDKTRPECTPKDDPFNPHRNGKSMGRKYVQENIFKPKPEKEHREIVISDQVVKSSKLYRMLREKIDMEEAMFTKEINALAETKSTLKHDVATLKNTTYNTKLALWELKNEMLELKHVLAEEEQEAARLERDNEQQEDEEEGSQMPLSRLSQDPEQQSSQDQKNALDQENEENEENAQNQNGSFYKGELQLGMKCNLSQEGKNFGMDELDDCIDQGSSPTMEQELKSMLDDFNEQNPQRNYFRET